MPIKKISEKDLPTKRKRLFFDIEVSPNIGMFWDAGYKKNIDYSNIIKERAIICICYKWEDEKILHSLTWDKDQSDKTLLEQFIKVANESDEIVGHNGDRFDLSWIRTRCLFHKIDMFPKYTTIDTLKISRSKFKFNSNKLDYIAKFLGVGKKIKTDFSLWTKIILNSDEKSLIKMVKYCKMDVVILENIYKKMSVHIEHKTHYGVIFGQDRGTCPNCGSLELIINKTKVLASGKISILFQCKVCGKYTTKSKSSVKNY